MYCRKCGKEIMDEAVVCVHCGCSTKDAPVAPKAPADAPNLGMAIVGFLVPVAGLILWAVNKDTQPLMAKSAGKGAIIGFCVSIACTILYYAAIALFYFVMFLSAY